MKIFKSLFHPYRLIFLFISTLILFIHCRPLRSDKKTNAESNSNEVQKLSLIREQFIYDTASFPQCHASTIVQLKNGKLMASWFGGTREKAPDVTIWISTFDDKKWNVPLQIADGIQNDSLRYPCWNPVLFQHSTGRLYLFYKVGPSPSTWWGMMRYTDDNGIAWSLPERLPKNILGPIRAKPIEMANGDLLCPSSLEYTDGPWKVNMELYSPKTNLWTHLPVDSSSKYDVIQPTILQHSQHKLQILCRSQQDKIIQSWSEDNGSSWGKLTETNLPNPSAGIDAITLPSGQHLLVYNPTVNSDNDRSKLNIAISNDGENWSDIYFLENQPEGEFSYPAIIQTTDGSFQITYTWNRRKIKQVTLVARNL